MSNLNNNTTQLELLLVKVNALPDAGTSGEDLDAVIAEQAELIEELSAALDGKAIGGGGASDPVLQEKSVTPTKSAQTVVADSGYDGLSKVNVGAIPSQYIEPSGTKAITTNGTHDVTANASVSVNVPIPDGYVKPSGTLAITENGTHNVKSYALVNVNVPSQTPNIQPLEVTANGTYTASSGVDGYSPITVNVQSSGENKLAQIMNCSITNVSADDFGGATSIKPYLFSECVNLTTVTIPQNVKKIGESAFKNCSSLASVSIPTSVTTINSGVFFGCSALTSISIPNGVKSIQSSLFHYCSSLTSVSIPTSVTTINSSAFTNCSSLKSISIPSSVTNIRSNAFSFCSRMEIYDFSNHSIIPTLEGGVFVGIIPACKIKVPEALYDKWIVATNWSEWADNIVSVPSPIAGSGSDD